PPRRRNLFANAVSSSSFHLISFIDVNGPLDTRIDRTLISVRKLPMSLASIFLLVPTTGATHAHAVSKLRDFHQRGAGKEQRQNSHLTTASLTTASVTMLCSCAPCFPGFVVMQPRS